MVRKVGQQDGRLDLKNFFMDRCPKNESTAKNLFWNKSSSHSLEKLEKPVGGGGGIHPPGHRNVKKHFRLFMKIAPLYNKQNRLIFEKGFLVRGLLLYIKVV